MPSSFKNSTTTPIFKSGDKKRATNFRPITVINNFAKIFEKCLKSRIVNFCNKHNIISPSQFGFRENTSTEKAVYQVAHTVFKCFQDRRKCLTVFLDLAKAFDTVNHDILFNRLENSGIRGMSLSILKDYLTDRMQVVKINNCLSDPLPVSMGVPQGTVLGPVLFLLYINEIFHIEGLEGEIISYADDTAVLFSSLSWEDTFQKATAGIQLISNWLNKNLLSLNIAKTKFITFSSTNVDQPNNAKIPIHSSTCPLLSNCQCPNIEKTRSIKYLGIIVDQSMRWNEHMVYTTKRLRKLVYKFYQLRNILSKKVLLMVYDALVESIIRYCIIVWGGTFKSTLCNLEIIQKSILKVILKKHRRFSSRRLFEEADVFNVKQIYMYQCLLWLTNKNLTFRTHSYNTRTIASRVMDIPLVRLSHNQKFVSFIAPKLYNQLPSEIKNITNTKTMKNHLKLFVRDNFYSLSRLL